MRRLNQKLGLSHLSALLLVAAFMASPYAANAQTAVCELDWNCDGVVSWADVYEYFPGGLSQVKSRGFYSDVYYYVTYFDEYPGYVGGGYFHEYAQCGTPGNMDWNGDGVIDMNDAYEGKAQIANLDTFYTQWFVYEHHPQAYAYYYPNSDCDPVGPCEGIGDDDDDDVCNDIDNCPNIANPDQEDTDGNGIGDACQTCDPGYQLVDGSCVDIDECADTPDICGTDSECENTLGSYRCNGICDSWYDAYEAAVEELTRCTNVVECVVLTGTSCGCTRDLVVNRYRDQSQFWHVIYSMSYDGCSILSTCDCPPADGLVCDNGHCAWNYL